jgi:hypothetical protein
MPERPFRVGAARRRITPPSEVGPVYRAGYKMMEAERLTGTVDEIFLRCMTVETKASRVIFLSLDLIGLFRDFTDALASRLAPQGIEPNSLIVATTHSHAAPDTMGAWGPSFGVSGYNQEYAEFLLTAAVDGVTEALESAAPAKPYLCVEETNLGVSNYREPDELNLVLWCLSFRGADGVIGSLISYSAQPELVPRNDDRISGDYPGEACRILDRELGGTTLFLLGPCGGMEPEGCEEGYETAHAYGRKLAEAVVDLVPKVGPVRGDTIAVRVREVELPVENDGFKLMMEHGIFETARRPPTARTTLSRIEIGEVAVFALPGESFPGIVAGAGPKDRILFVNQVNDSLGYFISPEHFRSEPVEWAEGHHFTGHELESLGQRAGEIIRKELISLAREPASSSPDHREADRGERG